MKKLTIGKSLGSLVLILAMILTMTVTALPSYAADGSISIIYNPQVPGLNSTPYTLYKVGTFGRYTAEEAAASQGKVKAGDAKILLDSRLTGDGIPDVNIIDVPPDTSDINSEGYVKWEREWLKAADALANFISTKPDVASAIKASSGTLDVKAAAQNIGPYDNGIYLLVGEKVQVGNRYWWPVPVLIMVLNGKTTFSIASLDKDNNEMRYNEVKMQCKPVVYKHTVTKLWDPDSPEATRCDVRVGIFYGEGTSLIDVDSVTLHYDKDIVQTYTWYSTETDNSDKTVTVKYYTEDPGQEGKVVNPKKTFTVAKSSTWSVRELRETAAERDALKYYESVVTYNATAQGASAPDPVDNAEAIKITNTFRKAKLIIEKDLIEYLNQRNANAMVVFEVSGYVTGAKEPGSTETEEKRVYHTKLGMAFNGPGQQDITIDDLPVNLDRLVVQEIYSTNYECIDTEGYTREVDLANPYAIEEKDGIKTKVYKVTFRNDYDGPPKYSKGIVNSYGHDPTKGFIIEDRNGKDQKKPATN